MKNQYIAALAASVAVLGGLIITGFIATPALACSGCGGGYTNPVQPVQPINNTYNTYTTNNNGGNDLNTNTNTNSSSSTNNNANTNNNSNANNVSINIGYAQAQAQQVYNQQPYYPPVNTLVCTPINQNVGIGQTAVLIATGGDSNYTWTIPEFGQSSFGASFQIAYNTIGIHTVTVRSAGQVATCSVNVTGGQVLGDIDFPNTGAGGPDLATYGSIAIAFGLISLAIFYFERRARLN